MANLKDTVEFRAPGYDTHVEIWNRIDDVVAGEDAVKAAGEKYLTKPKIQSEKDYESFKKRAVFYNVTGPTNRSLVGAAYKKAPVIKLQGALKPLAKNINGAGLTIDQHSKKSLSEVLKKGRHCLYVDYPKTEGKLSKRDVKQYAVMPRVVSINAKNVINWRTTRINGVSKLSLVVISEREETIGNQGFSVTHSQRYRVLRLTNGLYQVQVWEKNSQGEFVTVGTSLPTRGDGNRWTEIPFIFIGSQNNDADIDDAPLLDLVNLNLAHYRNSADYEDSCFLTGQSQLVVAGLLDPETDENGDKKQIVLGSNSPLVLDTGGKAYYIQPAANSMPREAMQDKKAEMVSLGARLVKPGGAVKTATEAQHDNEAEHSVLSLCISNVNDAYVQAMTWCAQYMGSSENVDYAINTDFSYGNLNAQLITALVSLSGSGLLPESDMFNLLRKMELIDPKKTDEVVKDELENATDGLGLAS